MTIAQLGAGLNSVETGLKFAHFAWASAPSGDYGTYAEDGKPQFEGNNRNLEHLTHGYVNLFTRDDTGATQDAIESYFSTLQETEVFAWQINTIQYENYSKFIHVEWEIEFA